MSLHTQWWVYRGLSFRLCPEKLSARQDLHWILMSNLFYQSQQLVLNVIGVTKTQCVSWLVSWVNTNLIFLILCSLYGVKSVTAGLLLCSTAVVMMRRGDQKLQPVMIVLVSSLPWLSLTGVLSRRQQQVSCRGGNEIFVRISNDLKASTYLRYNLFAMKYGKKAYV